MGKYVAENVVKKLIGADIPVKNAKVAILGFTFKEDCPDTRNTKVIDIYRELQEYGITPVVADPAADGFQYHMIDEKACVGCGLCEKVCPVLADIRPDHLPTAYAGCATLFKPKKPSLARRIRSKAARIIRRILD